MIRVEHLSHDYTVGQGTAAVRDISFTVEDGEIFGFLGPSGAGKSTVQNILTSLLKLQSGLVLYDGIPIGKLKSDFYNTIGVSFEHPNLYEKLTGYENLKYYAGLFDVPVIDPMILLDRVNLASDAHKRTGSYSKGMKQRLVFCRALINNPKILFLDEPTSGLDPSTAEITKAIIREKKAEGCTIFLTTHNMFTADQLCDRVAFLYQGSIVAMDTPKALKLMYGEHAVEVEYAEDGESKVKTFSLDKGDEKIAFTDCIRGKEIRTIHTREASLEQIFIRMTGRGLSE